jgi:hypothetical protein
LLQTVFSQYTLHYFTESHVTAVFGGLFAGSLHALSGPDHLAAILPLILGKNWATASYYGCTWGYGHGLSSALLGVLGFFLRDSFVRKNVLPQLTTLADYAVGVTLIIIGIMGVLEVQHGEAEGEAAAVTTSAATAAAASMSAVSEGQDVYVGDGEVPLSNKWGGPSAAATLVTADAVGVSTAVLADDELAQASPRMRQLAATMTVFANGFLLGLSWDGLPSLAPTLALDSWHTLFCFVAAYCAGTVGGIGGASVAIAASTRLLSAVTTDDLPKRLSFMSSLVAIAIGFLWILQSLMALLDVTEDEGERPWVFSVSRVLFGVVILGSPLAAVGFVMLRMIKSGDVILSAFVDSWSASLAVLTKVCRRPRGRKEDPDEEGATVDTLLPLAYPLSVPSHLPPPPPPPPTTPPSPLAVGPRNHLHRRPGHSNHGVMTV